MKKILSILPVVAVMIFLTGCGNRISYDSFAQCLTEKGAVMYGAYWCTHCQAQKREFGKSSLYINYVECADEKQKCIDAGIERFPTWIIGGIEYEGRRSMEELGRLTACELPLK